MLSHGKCHKRLLPISPKTCSLWYYITVFISWFSWKLSLFVILHHQFPSVMGEYSVGKNFFRIHQEIGEAYRWFWRKIIKVYMNLCCICTHILHNIDLCLIHPIIKKHWFLYLNRWNLTHLSFKFYISFQRYIKLCITIN